MLSTVLGILAGLAVGALVFVVAKGGVLGLVLGAVGAVAGYVAVSSLLEQQRKVGGIQVDYIPDGERVIEVIDEANRRVLSISAISSQIINGSVNKEAADFIAATQDLIRYVEANPQSYTTLQHYINVYGEQTERLLQGYLDVERSGGDPRDAVSHTVKALRALETTAAGELQRAVDAKTLMLTADSDAIVRLASMDGYDTDEEDFSTPNMVTGAAPGTLGGSTASAGGIDLSGFTVDGLRDPKHPVGRQP